MNVDVLRDPGTYLLEALQERILPCINLIKILPLLSHLRSLRLWLLLLNYGLLLGLLRLLITGSLRLPFLV